MDPAFKKSVAASLKTFKAQEEAELADAWPFLWYENEYVVDAATAFILAANAAQALTR